MQEAAAVPERQGLIVLARHGEPALSRRIRLSAEGYRRWWAAYEEGGILADQTPPSGLLELARGADHIFASTRKRAIETADALVQGKHFVRDPIFIEAPLPPPPLPPFIKLRPRTWGVLARTAWWFFGHTEGQESKGQASVRAEHAAERLIAAAEDGGTVLLLAHGFFNVMVGRALKRRGWRQSEGRGYRYWATRRFTPGPRVPRAAEANRALRAQSAVVSLAYDQSRDRG
jgi:broad specificity phosphatase PhoE